MNDFLKKLKIDYTNADLYVNAFTHPSFAHEHKTEHNQRLEFLGDAVFDLIISQHLFKNIEYNEGEMTKLRAIFVCESALCFFGRSLGFAEHLLVGKGEQSSIKDAIVADAFEAFVAAIYLDCGFSGVEKFFFDNILPLMEDNKFVNSDYKSKLQELVQSDKRTLKYKVVKQDGPSHEPTFYVNVFMDNILFGEGIGNSKKVAEQMAAKCALEKMATGG